MVVAHGFSSAFVENAAAEERLLYARFATRLVGKSNSYRCCSVRHSNASINLIYQIFIEANVFLLVAYFASAMRGEGGQKKCGRSRHMSISSEQTHSGGMPSTAYAPEAGHFYRFYSIDIGGRIVLAEDHECESDTAAISLGNRLLTERRCPTIEVWLDRQRVSVIENRSWLGA
jgi:hypothetical protein